MSRIAGVGPVSGSNTGGRGWNGGGATGFAVPGTDASAPSGLGHTIPTPAVTLGGILALQETDQEPPPDREARKRGRALLAALADLQQTLLLGADETEPLRRLAALAVPTEPATSAELQSIVQAVALRALVELARRGL